MKSLWSMWEFGLGSGSSVGDVLQDQGHCLKNGIEMISERQGDGIRMSGSDGEQLVETGWDEDLIWELSSCRNESIWWKNGL